MSNEITVQQQAEIVPKTVCNNDLIMMAIQKDFDVDRLEKLLNMQERHEKRQAEKAFYQAMAEFKRHPPQILKDTSAIVPTKAGTMQYRYARLGAICTALTEALATHGLSASWKTVQERQQITVTCTLEHRDGHTRSTSLSGPMSDRGISEVQKMASTVTYLERYTLLAITGIATLDQDDDDASATQKPQLPRAGRKIEPKQTAERHEQAGTVVGIVEDIAKGSQTKSGQQLYHISIAGGRYGTTKEDLVNMAQASKEMQEIVKLEWKLYRGYWYAERIVACGDQEQI